MSHHFGKQKFYFALLNLVAPGDIHSRVSAALSQHLLHIKEDDDLPESVRKEYLEFKNSLDIGNANDGHVVEIINNMSEVDAEKVAQHMVALYEKVIVG
jgi:hypothetical protein